jgi:sulfonate transport system permease protein
MLVRDYAASRFSALWSETVVVVAVVVVAVAVALYALVSVVERPVVRRFAAGQG